MANFITSSRIVLSCILFLFPTFSPGFYVVYSLAGFTDMIDGTIARKKNTVSEFGSRLDTIADLIFLVTCMLKIFPEIQVPVWTWVWIGIIFLIKIGNMAHGYMKERKMIVVHSFLNKVTGLSLFCMPFVIGYINQDILYFVLCVIASIAAVQEGFIVQKGKRKNKREV